MEKYKSDFISFYERFICKTSRGFNWIACSALCIMPIPVFIDVILRFTISKAIPGGIEIQEFLLLILVFLGLASTEFEGGGHIQIDLLIGRLPSSKKFIIEVFVWTVSSLILVFMFSQLLSQGINRLQNNEMSKTLQIPIWIFWIVGAVGILGLSLVVLFRLVKAIQSFFKLNSGNKNYGLIIVPLIVSFFLFFVPIFGFRSSFLSNSTYGLLGMLLLFILLFLGVPIAFGMALIGFLGMVIINRAFLPSLAMLGIGPYDTSTSYMLTVVPLFILMGELAYHSGISNELFETANKWLGSLRGGLAMSAVAGCAGFAAVCGDSLATAVTMSSISVPEMKKKGYDMSLATGALAAGGTLGIMIPPSVGFIFYAIVTEESIGKLFIAGIFPGIILTLLFIGYIALITKIRPNLAPPGNPTTLREKIISLKGVIGMVTLFILILGGILTGIFNAIEGGAIGAVGASVYALIKKCFDIDMLFKSLKSTVNITCKLIMILMGVAILGYFLAATRLPFFVADFVSGLGVNRYIIFSCIIIFFLILGCLLNVIPMILLVLPTIFPTIVSLGFDPIWFGVVTVLMMEAGQITPPIGVNVFAISAASGVPMYTVFKGILPFFVCMIILLIIITIFPQIALFLPKIFFK